MFHKTTSKKLTFTFKNTDCNTRVSCVFSLYYNKHFNLFAAGINIPVSYVTVSRFVLSYKKREAVDIFQCHSRTFSYGMQRVFGNMEFYSYLVGQTFVKTT